MRTLAILFALTGAGEEGLPQDMINAWQKRETENPVFDLSWRIVRDSRSIEWTGSMPASEQPLWRLRVDRDNYRLDGWQPILSASDPRPDGAAADRERTKTEFIAYLQSGFAEPARAATTQKLAILLRPGGYLPDGLGELDRLVIGTALISLRPFSNPLLKLSRARLKFEPRRIPTPDGELTVLSDSSSDAAGWEIWADPKHRYRPVRIFLAINGVLTRQIDFEYDAEAPETPLRWTVVSHDPVSRLTSYSTAERRAVHRTPLDPGTFEIQKPKIATIPIVQESTGTKFRRWIRAVVYHASLPIVLISLPIGSIIWRSMAVSRSDTPHSGPSSELSANAPRGVHSQNQKTGTDENDVAPDS